MRGPSGRSSEERALVLAPYGRDAVLTQAILADAGLTSEICSDVNAMVRLLGRAAGFAIVAEEALGTSDLRDLSAWISAQPAWSDFPFILLTRRNEPAAGGLERNATGLRFMELLGNVFFLERPSHPTTLVSAARAALRARRRQYQARDYLEERVRSAAALEESGKNLRLALDAGRLGDWSLDPRTRELNASSRFKAIVGRGPDDPFSYDDLLAIIHPADRNRVQVAMAAAIAGRTLYDVEYRLVLAEGRTAWMMVQGRTLYSTTGEPLQMVGVSADITDRKQAEQRQALLIRELHHRVKNTLTTVNAIVGSTARSSRSVDEFYQSFAGRIASLAKTHSLLTEAPWQTVSLIDLLNAELQPYDDDTGQRVVLNGPEIELPSDMAVPIGMAIHELSTNAAKYGALSVLGGGIVITWTVDASRSPSELTLTWIESGGPPVEPPKRQGFGSRLLERVLASQLGATIAMDFDPGGLRFRMVAPFGEGEAVTDEDLSHISIIPQHHPG